MSRSQSKPDQYQLRFPPGLRERVKAAAERNGRSMNAEIIQLLEEKFPEPWSLDVRINYLIQLLGALRKVRTEDSLIDTLTREVFETVEGIASGRAPEVEEGFRARVQESLDAYLEMLSEDEEERSHWHESEPEGGDLEDEDDKP